MANSDDDKQQRPRTGVAPVVTDTLAFTEWVLRVANQRTDVLSQRLVAASVDLAEQIGFAWKNRERAQRLDEADDTVLRLRILLRLAGAAEVISRSQMLFGLDLTERIGRQIGGWMKVG